MVVAGKPLSPGISRRVEVLLRQRAQLPPGATISVSTPVASDVPGYADISVAFTSEGKTSRPVTFLLSTDGRTVAQFSKYDISADPRSLVSDAGRPARGGPANAPVIIAGFDDLECPYCARLHASIFPAITQRYGDKVRIVYKDFPLEQHPWAMRAAVDVNCLGAQSPAGYWTEVDEIHARADEVGAATGPAAEKDKEKTLPRANEQLDKLTREVGASQKVDMPKLEACIAKQDTSAIDASKSQAASLNVESTPTLFINGAKIDGAVPIEFLFSVIDDALRAENVSPPPPYVAPQEKLPPALPKPGSSAPPAAPAAKSPAAPAAKSPGAPAGK